MISVLLAAVGALSPLPGSAAAIGRNLPAEQRFATMDTAWERFDKTVFYYDACVFAAARTYALRTAEPAEVVRDAAFGSCSEWSGTLEAAMTAIYPNIGRAEIDGRLAKYRGARADRVLAAVLDARMNAPRRKR
ncbi:MAG: hypothetical protein V4579_03765 [Pseudomonadota bacterium]